MIKESSVGSGLAGCESSRNKLAPALPLPVCLAPNASTASMAFRRRGFRRGWGGPFWGPAPLLYTGAAVGAGYAIGRRGGDYYGEDPYPQPGVAPQQRPSQLVVRVRGIQPAAVRAPADRRSAPWLLAADATPPVPSRWQAWQKEKAALDMAAREAEATKELERAAAREVRAREPNRRPFQDALTRRAFGSGRRRSTSCLGPTSSCSTSSRCPPSARSSARAGRRRRARTA